MIRTIIHPTGVFDRPALQKALGFSASCLRREERLSRLRAYTRGKRRFYLGRGVIAWLEAGLVERPAPTDASHQS